MKLGILGTGMIVQDLMRTYEKLNVEKTYVLATPQTLSEAEDMVSKYHLDKVYVDYDELLSSDVDTIYCALPNHLHYVFSKKAIEKGKHVIIEKPITSNEKELEELIELAKKHDVMIFEAMNIHYLPTLLSLKENIHKVGNIKVVSFNYSQYSSRYDAFKQGKILPVFDYHKSGGALYDINVYNIHTLIDLFDMPQSVQYLANVEKGIDTSGMMVLDYGSFKAVSIGAKDCKAPIISTIQGDQGVIVIEKPVNQMVEYQYIDNGGHVEKFQFDNETHRLYYEFKEFMRMIEEKDIKKQQAMLELSLSISRLMHQARKQAHITFSADEEEK